ncbi:MAG: SPOR domain-containing protein [Gammaproteobacteria bacterium]|nr:SPOR domain-containing protein [Gammaproteobacteria bacterium]
MKSDVKHPTTKASQNTSGWPWMLSGLSLGLIVAVLIYINNRHEIDKIRAQIPNQMPVEARLESAPETPAAPEVAIIEHPADGYTFYEMLPKENPQLESGINPISVVAQTNTETNDLYILQVGSFIASADAERMRTNLMILNIESRIEEVTIDLNEYHRVIIGPIEGINELNSLREQLSGANIDVYMRTVSD